MKTCPNCRYHNQDRAQVCNLCGQVLSRSDEPTSSLPPPDPKQAAAAKASPAKPAAPAPSPSFPGRPLDLGFYLVCAPQPPVKLAPGTEYLIGREHGNQLVLSAAFVSRRHTSIRWNGFHYVLRDLGSANGTIVNGALVKEHVLKPGDRITIGTFHIEFVAVTPEGARRLAGLQDDGATAIFDPHQTDEGTWSGSLAVIGIPNIVQMLEADRKSGILTILVRGTEGRICFLEGRLIHAELGTLRGEDAVYPLLALAEGAFRFLPSEPDAQPTIETPLQGLLLEATRRADEARRKA